MYYSMVHIASLNFLIGGDDATIATIAHVGLALRQLQRIHCFAHFMPVVEEVRLEALPDGQADYPRLKPQCSAQNRA